MTSKVFNWLNPVYCFDGLEPNFHTDQCESDVPYMIQTKTFFVHSNDLELHITQT